MMTKVQTLGIPLKRASEVTVVKPLKNVIRSNYQNSEQDSYIPAINEFSNLRTNAVLKLLDPHENSLEVLYRYYDQIVALEGRILNSELQIPFKWKDAFDKGSMFGGRISLTVTSLSYEKICVLFNIAALQSQVASSQTGDSDDGMKQAAKLFQSSAGILNHLKTIAQSSLQQTPTPDLQTDTLSAISSLMVAQAQEVITIKAVADNMKPLILTKLCSQLGEMYADTLKIMQKEVLKPLWDRDWLSQVSGKQAAYQGLAHYYQSRVCSSDKIIGEEIARLRLAMELFKTAQTRSGDSSFFSEDLSRAQRFHTEIVKDNDFIYHERVPDAANLTPLAKAPVAKPTPMPEKFSKDFTDLFESLVPLTVQQALVQYNIRKEEIVNNDIAKLRDATQLLNSVLASLNLPAAIEDTQGGQLPQSLREKAIAVCNKGGIQAIEKLIQDLPDLLKRNREILDECDRLIKEEKDSDDQCRSQFRERWTRTPSTNITSSFQANAEKYRKVIDSAIQADATLRGKYDSHREAITMLSNGPDSLSATLPSVGASSVGNDTTVDKLRQLMKLVEQLKTEREVTESELKGAETDMRDVFLSALAQDGAVNEPALSTDSLGRVYGPLQDQVRASLNWQEELVQDIQKGHLEFSQNRGQGGTSDRESTLKKLASGHDAYIEITKNLEEGTKFYNDLTQLLVTFQSKINDFCFARRTEKEELMKDLTRGLASQNMASTPTAPAHHAEVPAVAPRTNPPPAVAPYAPYAPPPGAAPYAPPPGAAPYAPPPGAASYAPPPAYAPPAYSAQQAPGNLPYPVNPQGMPTPQGQSYPVYTPMPQGYSPYANPQPGYNYAAPQGPYPQQPYGYPQPPQQPPQWPPST